ncbi:MAG: dihydroneopterin aldolase family protein [Methanomicrobiaceae archaeon]|nr:dihydroneopterin aldolase family protein [Methanomicrobiaceae archaeon]
MEKKTQAAFEAGIKLGALYHQWVGTPISPATAPSVEQAIQNAVSLQPYVEDIKVRIHTEHMVLNSFGYSELAGKMFDVTITTKVGNATCVAELKLEEDYPMMKILEIR